MGALLLCAAVLAGIGYRNARADPVVRRMIVRLPHWPAGAAPVTVALLSDIHLGGPAMDADGWRGSWRRSMRYGRTWC